jgi:hypothetical protein
MSDNNMISWSDYEGVDGFGQTSREEVAALNKALQVGQSINAPVSAVSGDGFAMRVESLESTLKVQTSKMEHIVFWRNVPKLPEWNTVAEYNVLHDYGTNEDGLWVGETDLPEEDDSTFERKYAIVKFMGTTRKVSHVATLIKSAHGQLVAMETVNGTMHLLRGLERALFYGDSALSALQFDGYEKLIKTYSPSTNIVDMRGRPLSEDALTDAALIVNDAPNYGIPTDLYCSPKVKTDLVKAFFPKERYDLFSKPSNGMIGLDIKGFTSPIGDVRFQPDVFINDGGAPSVARGDSSKRPGTPTVSTAATTPADALSKFIAEDAGNYYYTIQAVNRYGCSAGVVLVAGPTPVAVAAGDRVTWAMTPGVGGSVDYYRVYRTKVGGASGTERLILRVANAAGAGAQTINDYNNYLPYCSSAFLFQQNLESMSFKQLAPMVRIPLATIDTSIRWAQVIYGVPVMYTPGKNLLFTNIGRAVGALGT